MIINKTKRTASIYNRGREVAKVYDHGKLAWQKSAAIPDYLCFTALEAGQFTLTIPAAVTATYLSYVEWSKDGRTWNHTDNTSEAVTIDVQVASGDKVYWRGSGVKYAASNSSGSKFNSTANFNASGNIMSLLYGDNYDGIVELPNYANVFTFLFFGCETIINAADLLLPATRLRSSCYRSMFQGCKNLVTAPVLPALTLVAECYLSMFENCLSLVTPPTLPATTIAGYCYYRMFANCTSLTTPPALPATTLFGQCYRGMFRGSGITTAPALPATTLQSYCYCEMFQDCKSLTTPPDLPALAMVTYCYSGMFNGSGITTPPVISATSFNGGQAHCRYMFRNCKSLTTAAEINIDTLAANCYQQMYMDCTNLSHIKCLATDISATDCLTNWTSGVAADGTFIKDANTTWPRGASGIPTGWVDVEKRTMPSGYKQVEYVANPNKPSATPMPIVETGIVLDPSQDTIEIAVFPHIDDDGYIAHHRYGGLPIANNMSPAQSGAKVGRFYCMYRKIDSANVIQFSWTKATSANSTLTATNKIVETPQVLRIELSSGNNKMLLNGTQVATNLDACDISDPGTETAKLFGINNVGYNWIDPIYYMKWWRNGVLIADYVACVRESDNEPSFYDFVSNTFKVPTRTGFFTAGEEI